MFLFLFSIMNSMSIIKKYLISLIIIKEIVFSNPKENLVTEEEFTKCVALFGFEQFPNNTYELFVEKITQIGGIDSKLEALMAITQLSWESAGFTATASWACSKAYDRIEYWEVREKCESYDKKGCPKTKNYYGRGYAQIKHCYNYRSASIELYNDERLVDNPELMAENNTIAMETAIWFWKSRVHNVSGVKNGHFGASTKAIVSDECGHFNNQTDIAKKRYQRFVDCLKVCNYTENNYSEIGCYPIPEQMFSKWKISLIIIGISTLVVIAVIGLIFYYFKVIFKESQTISGVVVEGQQYESVGEGVQYYSTFKNEQYDDTMNHDVDTDNEIMKTSL